MPPAYVTRRIGVNGGHALLEIREGPVPLGGGPRPYRAAEDEIRFRSIRLRGQNVDGASRTQTNDVGEAKLGVLHLAGAGLPAQVGGHFENVRNARGAQRVSL
jgi:hypothetical protein